MLIEFSVENYRSFRERATLSMIAAKLRSRDEQLDQDNVIVVNDKLSLLRSAAIYGANASGKSNLIKAFATMRDFVGNSARGQAEDEIPVEPFLLDEETSQQPSTFEVVFLLENIQYRYGFSATSEKVLLEWLYYVPKSHEVKLFTRKGATIDLGAQFREGHALEDKTRANALFLSVVSQFDGKKASAVRQYIYQKCHPLVADNMSYFLPYTKTCIESGKYMKDINGLIHSFDLGIAKIEISSSDAFERASPKISVTKNGLSENEKKGIEAEILNKIKRNMSTEIAVVHDFKNTHGEKKEIRRSLKEMESDGTQKVIALSGPLFDALAKGYTLFLDEIDAHLHPLLTAAIIKIFNSPETNLNNAQLVYVTHDTNLLDRKKVRRDQIYFAEKDKKLGTKLYSLADFKLESKGVSRTVRNDASYEENYIQGRYGAIPYLGNLKNMFTEELLNEQPLVDNED